MAAGEQPLRRAPDRHPLIVKRGGHADQLSRTAGLDKFRIAAIVKLLDGDRLER